MNFMISLISSTAPIPTVSISSALLMLESTVITQAPSKNYSPNSTRIIMRQTSQQLNSDTKTNDSLSEMQPAMFDNTALKLGIFYKKYPLMNPMILMMMKTPLLNLKISKLSKSFS